MKRIFISSTFSDLKEYRKKVTEAVRRLGAIDISMENFGARDSRPKEECLRLIREESDLYIGIFAYRYGYIPPGDSMSITESEYLEASKVGLPRLIYLLRKTAPWNEAYIDRNFSASNLEALKTKLKERHICGFFTSSDNLAAQVAADIGRLLLRDEARRGSQVCEYLHDQERELRLINNLKSSDKYTIKRSIIALSHSNSSWLIHSLKQFILGKDEDLAEVAIDSLREIPGKEATKAIATGLLSESVRIRKWAAFTLGELALFGRRRESRLVINDLIESLNNPSEHIQVLEEIVHSICKIGGQDAFNKSIEVLRSNNIPYELKAKVLYGAYKFFDEESCNQFILGALSIIRTWSLNTLSGVGKSPLFKDLPSTLKKTISERLKDERHVHKR